jgi:hypothetical protein
VCIWVYVGVCDGRVYEYVMGECMYGCMSGLTTFFRRRMFCRPSAAPRWCIGHLGRRGTRLDPTRYRCCTGRSDMLGKRVRAAICSIQPLALYHGIRRGISHSRHGTPRMNFGRPRARRWRYGEERQLLLCLVEHYGCKRTTHVVWTCAAPAA